MFGDCLAHHFFSSHSALCCSPTTHEPNKAHKPTARCTLCPCPETLFFFVFTTHSFCESYRQKGTGRATPGCGWGHARERRKGKGGTGHTAIQTGGWCVLCVWCVLVLAWKNSHFVFSRVVNRHVTHASFFLNEIVAFFLSLLSLECVSVCVPRQLFSAMFPFFSLCSFLFLAGFSCCVLFADAGRLDETRQANRKRLAALGRDLGCVRVSVVGVVVVVAGDRIHFPIEQEWRQTNTRDKTKAFSFFQEETSHLYRVHVPGSRPFCQKENDGVKRPFFQRQGSIRKGSKCPYPTMFWKIKR